MSNTHDDGVDPAEGILADLASLRASREAAENQRNADPTTLSALDQIAEAAGRLRAPLEDDRDDDADDAAEAPARSRRRTPARAQAPAAPVSAPGGLFFVADPAKAADDDGDDYDDEQDDADESQEAARSTSVDTRNPFSHSSSADASSYAPLTVPAGGGLLFQPPQPDLAEEVDDSWFDDDSDDDDDDRGDRDGDQSDDSSDDSSDDRRGQDDRSRSRRRRGGRGRRSRNRGGDDQSTEDRSSGDRASDDSDDSDDDRSRGRGDSSDRSTSNREAADDRDASDDASDDAHDDGDDSRDDASGSSNSRRGGRRGRRRRGSGDDSQGENDAQVDDSSKDGGSDASDDDDSTATSANDSSDDHDDDDAQGSRRRRRRRGRSSRRDGGDGGSGDDQVTAIKGSTRMEAKRQRRREGREAGRRRPLLTEAEFLARRESVERTMLVREQEGRTQLVVLEDGIAVEHYLSEHKAQASLIGNVYLGRVQNVLPSMEAAFIDIGKGRNAVLYAGEVNWDALGMNGKPHRIEQALSAGDPVLVQVTKDPVGHKGARLTSQISLPGRFLVYIPGNSMTGISRKLPDNERARLKKLLKEILPEKAGVIVRTASEGASDEELRRDVDRLSKRWESIETKANAPKAQAPRLLYSEPDMIVRIIRDVFNEDFDRLVIDGDGAWETIHEYVEAVAPDLLERVSRYGAEDTPTAEDAAAGTDIFDHFRVNEQIEKALNRKVNLPSGGSLVIDRTEAMTVVDVNTGKFTGSGGNLEETVTKNNLEAAEEVIRQLRLRDIGGIIVVDFIDMVLESNRDLVTRRLVECLARDRTRHQVAEVTSLGLVQMTRKRIGTGLAESFAAAGEDMSGRGLMLPGTDEKDSGGSSKGGSNRGSRRSRGGNQSGQSNDQSSSQQSQQADPDTEKKQDQSRSAVAAIAKATLKKSDDDEHAEETAQADTAEAVLIVGGEQDAQATGDGEGSSNGRRSRRRGGRSRNRKQDESAQDESQTEDASASRSAAEESAAADPVLEESQPAQSQLEAPEPEEPRVEAWQAFVPAADSGPAPFMIGAEATTTVQSRPEPVAAAPAADEQTDEQDTAEEPTQQASEEKPAAEPEKPALPFLIVGMED